MELPDRLLQLRNCWRRAANRHQLQELLAPIEP